MKAPKERNPFVEKALFRKAGAHGKTAKAQRQQDKIKLKKHLDNSDSNE